MGSYYPELLLDVCVVCAMGLMADIGPEARQCCACGVVETIVYGEIKDLSIEIPVQ